MKCDGTRAETRFGLLAKRTSPFKSTGASVQSTTGSRGVRISLQGFVLLVQACVLQSCDAYRLPSPFSCFPFTSPPVRHRVPSHFKSSLQKANLEVLTAVLLQVQVFWDVAPCRREKCCRNSDGEQCLDCLNLQTNCSRVRLECDGTRAETKCSLSGETDESI
jgi:hypothetical protein